MISTVPEQNELNILLLLCLSFDVIYSHSSSFVVMSDVKTSFWCFFILQISFVCMCLVGLAFPRQIDEGR